MFKMEKSTMRNKKIIKENNLTIMSKPYAHYHTIKPTDAKFQKDQYKTVRGVARARHRYKIVILKNNKVHKLKNDINLFEDYVQITHISSYSKY